MIYLTFLIPIVMAFIVLIYRMKATKTPITRKKIILPPIFMSTGALMFVFPMFRVTLMEFLEALILGMIFSLFLIMTTKFKVEDNQIYVKQSKAFLFIIVGLLIIRIVMKLVLSLTVDIGATGGMFWILAFGMIVPWRFVMLVKYTKLEKQLQLSTSKVNSISNVI